MNPVRTGSSASPLRLSSTTIPHHVYDRELTKKRHQQRSLACSCGTNNQIDLTTLEQKFLLNPEREISSVRSRGEGSVIVARPSECGVVETDDRLVKFRANLRSWSRFGSQLFSKVIEKLSLRG